MKKALKNQQGFTLIELMIVVAIIGILAAVAIPQYQDYTKRAHVTEGVNLASSFKNAIAEYRNTNNAWPANATSAGISDLSGGVGNAVTSIIVGANGIITVTYNDKVDADASETLILTPDDAKGTVQWTASGTLDSKLRPSSLR